MADSYNDQDLYGNYAYEDGETPASLSALIATFRNLRVNSAMIEDLAVQNQHVQSLNAAKLEAGSIIAQDIIFKGTLEGADGTFTGKLISDGPDHDVIIEDGYIRTYDAYGVKNQIGMGGFQINPGDANHAWFDMGGIEINLDGTDFKLSNKGMSTGTVDIYTNKLMKFYGGYGFDFQGKITHTGDGLELYRDGGAYIDFHHTLNSNDFDARIILTPSNELQFHMNGILRHSFRADGSKAGGSIEIDGENLGMSPIDSPQMPIEYVEFDIQLVPEGSRISLDARFIKAVEKFAVFQNNGEIIEKGTDYFIISGDGVADCRIIGLRKGYADMFWASMETA